MNRKELLEQNLTEEKNVKTVVATAQAADNKFMKRAKRDLEDEIEDLEEKLKERLSYTTPIDKSVVEQTYSNLKDKKAMLQLYKEFEAEFLTENNSAQ